jgi:predicted transcriptional regulator
MLIELHPSTTKTITCRVDDELYYSLTALSQSVRKDRSVLVRKFLVDGIEKARKTRPTNFFELSSND